MPDRPYEGPVNHERLSAFLRVLAVPTRVLLLEKLRNPSPVSEISLPSFRKDTALADGRPLSRQAVEWHLNKLRDAGLVTTQPSLRGEKQGDDWVVNQARLFTLADELRRLTFVGPPTESLDHTAPPGEDSRKADARPLPPGPSLILVSGPFEGRAFPLTGLAPWFIGRAPGSAVTVSHDPFVSSRNTEIVRDGDGLSARSLRESRNGTTVNWRRLEPDVPMLLESGDTIGVGRSLFVVRGA